MFRSDAQIPSLKVDSIVDHINTINVDVISRIETELDPYDVISMVFLLYDVPDTALQRLIVYQRVSQDMGEKNLNLLYEWAQHIMSTRPTWRYEFLEALAICQLNNVIRKLGFNPQNVRKHYQPDNINTNSYINPMKKALYKLCENVSCEDLRKLQNTLKTYEIETTEYRSCELVLLELMCKKFITIETFNVDRMSNSKYQIEKLVKIIHIFPALKKISNKLIQLQSKLNYEPKSSAPKTSTPTVKHDTGNESDHDDDKVTATDFGELFDLMSKLKTEDTSGSWIADTKKTVDGAYAIKNPKRIGVCYIINQEDFHPSKESIESNSQQHPLDRRDGSNKDKKALEKTMSSLFFEVIIHENLDHKKIIEYIKNIIKYRVQPDDSVFMLCILSHGVRGHVFASDSVKVKIDVIQNLLDEGLKERNLEIPKVMILQACQVNNDEPPMKFVADGPSDYFLKKINFLIYWATAPELEAFRHEKKGSIFIQILCYVLQRFAKQDHLYDIFTKVTDGVAQICTKFQKAQVPIFESTLRKKLYLHIPE